MLWQKAAFACIVLFCLSVLGLAAIRSGEHFPDYRRDVENNKEYCASDKDAEERHNSKECQSLLYLTLADPIALLTFGLTIATIALFVVTGGLFYGAIVQARDGRTALAITRQTSEQQLRAYVLVETTVARFEKPDYVAGEVIVKNYGQTPAAKVCITRGIDVLPINGRDISDNIKSMPATIIGPNGTQGVVAVTQIKPPEYKKIIESINGGTSIILFGFVTYEDVFGTKRTTSFRYFSAQNTRGGIDFMPCPQGNSYT